MAGFDSISDDDWTNGQFDGGGATVPMDDFVIPEFDSVTNVDQVEQEASDNKFQSPPPGSHLFDVVKLYKDPEQVEKSGYVRGVWKTYKVYAVKVILAVHGKRNQSIFETLWLPTGNPDDLDAFRNSSSSAKGDNAGFMYRKTEQFLKRLGFSIATGQPFPVEARTIRNWFGRQVYANVVAGKKQIDPVTNKPKVDPGTGVEYEPRPQIELFSYREAESTVVGNVDGRTTSDQAPTPQAARPANSAQPRRPAPAGTHANSFVTAGLDKI